MYEAKPSMKFSILVGAILVIMNTFALYEVYRMGEIHGFLEAHQRQLDPYSRLVPIGVTLFVYVVNAICFAGWGFFWGRGKLIHWNDLPRAKYELAHPIEAAGICFVGSDKDTDGRNLIAVIGAPPEIFDENVVIKK